MLSKKVFLFCLLLVCIVRTSKAVKSIEIQLIRIEDIPTEEFKQASEVQNIQVATAGPGLVGLYVPLFMVLPRYFSCPSKVDRDCFAIGVDSNGLITNTYFHEKPILILVKTCGCSKQWA